MFGMSGTELLIILALGLLLFGPDRLPQMARMLGSALREFQKATGDIRSTVESEFHKLADLEPQAPAAPAREAVKIEPARGAVAASPQPLPVPRTRRDEVLARLERGLSDAPAAPAPAVEPPAAEPQAPEAPAAVEPPIETPSA